MNKFAPRSSVILLVAISAACARHSGDVAALNVGSAPVFETRFAVETGTATHSDYRVADFNGDGILDMAVVSLTGEMRILIGNGAGFTLGQELQIGGLPSWMAGGDLDNDGDDDLVVVRSDAGETNVYRNDGTGTFEQAGMLNVGAGALAVVVGDLNDDSIPDVAISVPSAPEIVVGFSDGQLGFSGQTQLALPDGGTAFNLAVGDANGNGQNDLVVADTSSSRLVLYTGVTTLGVGQEFCELQIAGTPGAIAFGDLSGDGIDDLVVSAYTANKYVVVTELLGPTSGQGQGTPVCNYVSFDVPVAGRPSLATVADVTGDGINDLVACLAFKATMTIGKGLAGGGVGEQMLLDSSGLPLHPYVGDFDGNGQNDVFALSGLGNRVNLWLARADGTLAGARSYASGLPNSSWLEGGDFDGDGDFELVTGSSSDTNLAIMGGVDMLMPEGTVDVGAGIFQLQSGDLDLDGLPDLVVGVAGGVRVLRNTSTPGAYSFELLPVAPAQIATTAFPFGITIGDFDLDADMDIAICDYVGGGLHLVNGTETPFVFDPEVILDVGGGPVDVAAADYTGDGLPDFAVSRANQSDIVILRNDTGSQYTEVLGVPVGQSPNYLVTSDFNRDGRADLVVSNSASGTVSVLFATENGFTGSDFAAGAAPTALLAQDLTGDGIDDILVASLQSGDFRILVGDGNGGFPELPSFPGTLGASDALLQDMTGDGLPDLMISSLISDRISFVKNISNDDEIILP